MKKRILSILLALCLCLSLFPTAAMAEGTSEPTTTTNKTLMLGASGISGYDSTSGYDYIYYGAWNSSPIKWRVLDTKTNMENATEGDGLFLLSDALLGTGTYGGVYFQQSYHSDSGTYYKGSSHSGDHTNCQIMNAWQGSDARSWCNSFYTTNLTSQEQGAVLATTKSDEAFTSSTYSVPFAASEKILDNDKVFFLSAQEAENGDYGFTNDTARIANYGNSAGVWWLRSPDALDPDIAGAVDDYGGVSDYYAYNDWAARPAFNLNLNSVLFTSAAEGGKISAAASGGNQGGEAADAIFEIDDYDGSEWKLTLLDTSRNNFSISGAAVNDGTISFSYSGAQTGTNEYISVVVVDNSAITHYGRILQLDGTNNGASGSASLSLPAGVTLSENTKLYVFNEQYNGGEKDDTKLTDYASQLIEVQSAVDTTAPALSNGTAIRNSETNATVKFTSDEAGEYYYEVVDSGATAPDIDTTKAGTSCDTTEQTISLDSLAGADAKDIYIVAKDAAGNVSQPLKITIPAYVAPVYSISADTTTLDFGTLYTGYTAPAAQTVTITNNGNKQITLTQPTAENYEIGELSATSLKPNETATFTVQPKSGLEVGTYNETITVQGANGGNSTDAINITASFAVTNKPSGSSSSGSSNPSYPVTTPKVDNGSVTVSPKYASKGTTVTITVTPDAGYTLETLTVTDKDGNAIELTDLGNGKYSFKMPTGKVTVNATFMDDNTMLNFFADVTADKYYYDAVLWAAKNGITGGTTATTFSPDDGCGRGQLVTFLWRVAGCPAAEYEMNFSDVGSSYYTEAVRWAASLGIVCGYGNGQFGAEDTITREQMAVILYRFAQAMGMDTTQGGMAVREYKDYETISDYAVTAIQWAVNAGVMQGYDGNLMPNQPCTRAQIVTMLYRLLGA